MKLRVLIKWILLIFVIMSSFLAVRQCYHHQHAPTEQITYDQLYPLVKGQTQVVLFHNKKRCHQCLQMEQFVKEVLNDKFSDEVTSGDLALKLLTIDDPENRALVEQFGIFAATLVLMEFEDDQLNYARVLLRGSELYRNESAFKHYVKEEVSEALSNTYE